MPDGQDLPEVRTHLAEQADDIIESDTDWPEFAEHLDISREARFDPYPDWHTGTDFEPVFLAALWAKTEDESITGLSDRLENNPEIAEAFGFDLDAIPHGDTFARAWRKRFEELQGRIERSAEQIDDIATKRGSPIGTGGLNPEETSGSSKRTEQRLLREKTKEVLEQMSNVIFPALNLPRPDDAIYSEEDLLELMTVMGMNNEAAHDGAVTYGDELAEKKDIPLDAPFYEDGMRGETLLKAIHELAADQVTDMVNEGAARAIERIKPYAEFPRPVFLAIDATYVAYYGDRDEMKWVTGTPDHKQYSWCHKYATITIVGEGIHMVVGMIPIGNPDARNGDAYPGSDDKSWRVGEITRELLDIACDHVTPSCVYADREFAAADTIAAFEEYNVKYMMPAPRNKRTKPWLRRFVDADRGIIAVEDDWPIHGPVKNGASNETVRTTLIGVPGNPDKKQYGYGEAADDDEEDNDEGDKNRFGPVPFYTNKEVSDEIALDRRRTMAEVKRYNRRGGIETSYKKIKEFAAWTTSKDFSVRLFQFGFVVLLYNAWLLVDILVQVGLDVEFRTKPRITAERFRRFVKRRLDRFI